MYVMMIAMVNSRWWYILCHSHQEIALLNLGWPCDCLPTEFCESDCVPALDPAFKKLSLPPSGKAPSEY